jgi:hypothetical protein
VSLVSLQISYAHVRQLTRSEHEAEEPILLDFGTSLLNEEIRGVSCLVSHAEGSHHADIWYLPMVFVGLSACDCRDCHGSLVWHIGCPSVPVLPAPCRKLDQGVGFPSPQLKLSSPRSLGPYLVELAGATVREAAGRRMRVVEVIEVDEVE